MRHALYLGCTAPVRAMNYELAARNTATRLGIELGRPVKEATIRMAIRPAK